MGLSRIRMEIYRSIVERLGDRDTLLQIRGEFLNVTNQISAAPTNLLISNGTDLCIIPTPLHLIDEKYPSIP